MILTIFSKFSMLMRCEEKRRLPAPLVRYASRHPATFFKLFYGKSRMSRKSCRETCAKILRPKAEQSFPLKLVHGQICWVMSKTVLGVFWTNWSSEYFQKHPKVFCIYLSNQISLRGRFVFKTNGMISSITSYKDHCCSFFTSWDIKATMKLHFGK